MNPDFGVFIPPEGPPYKEIKRMTQLTEELDYHSIWLSDHLHGMYENQGAPRYECWTLGTALAATTKRVKFGQLTMAVPFRNPALTAKMAATLDNITDGRVILSIGAGWHTDEFKGYGYDYGSTGSRSTRLEEAAKIIRLLWNEEKPSYKGKYYSIDGAYCSPKPVQNLMPLMIAGDGEKRTLRTAARYGDMTNYAAWTGTPDKFRAKTEILLKHCENENRDPDEITKTWAAFVFIDESMEKATEKMKKRYEGITWTQPGKGLVGTPESIRQDIYKYIDAGTNMFILSFLGGEWDKEANLFKEEVITNL
ncbi:MAG: LLM class flavin-dependent oxidoreductase [Candidatus Bathyarchaeota archaeon]|nr:LLM class flavin-dependent oxidoreductase [Candidatus Bathyarchaeota archaeon]